MWDIILSNITAPVIIIVILIIIYFSTKSSEMELKDKVVDGAEGAGSFFRESFDAFTKGVSKKKHRRTKSP